MAGITQSLGCLADCNNSGQQEQVKPSAWRLEGHQILCHIHNACKKSMRGLINHKDLHVMIPGCQEQSFLMFIMDGNRWMMYKGWGQAFRQFTSHLWQSLEGLQRSYPRPILDGLGSLHLSAGNRWLEECSDCRERTNIIMSAKSFSALIMGLTDIVT